MKNYCFLLIFLIFFSCTDDKDFAVNQDDCNGFDIFASDGCKICIRKDTAWYIANDSGERLYSADNYKVNAFFNVLRDIQVMGLSNHDSKAELNCKVELRKSQRIFKVLRFSEIPNSSQMIGRKDDGKCYIVGVPGLKLNPIVNFQALLDYWKDLSLLELSAINISRITVKDILSPENSFSIFVSDKDFSIVDLQGCEISGVSQQNIRKWLGAISGRYRAVSYCDIVATDTVPDNLIYRLDVEDKIGKNETILFYKKFNGNNLDFNLMYFRKGNDFGTIKYYDMDAVLTSQAKLMDN